MQEEKKVFFLSVSYTLSEFCIIAPLCVSHILVVSFSNFLRHASIFLQGGPHRIGSIYKKAVFKEYTDASYSRLSPRPDWLGFLGPILRAEVDETIVVHLKNFATRNYSMHPHGVFYEKDTEGKMFHTTGYRQKNSWCFCTQRHTYKNKVLSVRVTKCHLFILNDTDCCCVQNL